MPTEGESERARFTVEATQVTSFAWHLTVRGLPDTWTVAFDDQDFEQKIRTRIATDLEMDRDAFDVSIVDGHRGSASTPEDG